MHQLSHHRRAWSGGLVAAALVLSASAVSAQSPSTSGAPAVVTQGGTLNIDFATYNPLSLIIKQQGWLESALADQGISVNWVQSAGSNKANEALRSGAIDVGSTAGAAALLARSNESPIQVIDIYTQPEWSAIVIPAGSPITSVADLKGKNIAVTKGTDPYFFLLQALDEAGVSINDVTIQNLQHADGWAALQNGAVDAWSGLDPIMAGAEAAGATLLYRNIDFLSYGFLNATESFIQDKPDVAQTVVDAYEKARAWAIANPDETAALLAEVSGLEVPIAQKVITERTNFAVDNVPGDAQVAVLQKIGPVFVENGDAKDQASVDAALATLINPTFALAADPSRIPDAPAS